jgi:hypothetical protein
MKEIINSVEYLVLTVRGERIMLAADLATAYGVETRVLTQQVRRNPERFPPDFVFQLTANEFAKLRSEGVVTPDGHARLRSQPVIIKRGQHAKYPPYAFTEHGAIMAASVLNSTQAVTMSVYVVRAFVRMREQLVANAAILKRLAEIDKTLLEHDAALRGIWQQLQPLLLPPPEPPKRRIGFDATDNRREKPQAETRPPQKITKKT